MQLDDTAHILGGADFFSICNLEQRRMLAFAGERRMLKTGETLFRAGDVTHGAYVLISGILGSRQATTGEDELVEIDKPGTIVGELALITKYPRRATVVAKTDVELLLVPRTAFSKLMRQYPEIARRAAAKIRHDANAYVGALEQVKRRIEK